MRSLANVLFFLCMSATWLAPQPALAEQQTVCAITVNSADEQEAFRRHLPAAKYRFVELVERHRPDWLASACHAAIACDVLVISGHYGAGNEFFSDALEAREFLPIGELERVSCSDSCPSLFSRLKEAYLFGRNTLNPHAQHPASGEIARSLVREGRSRVEADRLARLLNSGHGESSRDRMRLVFKDVPVIYGFSSSAPLGPTAASTLSRFEGLPPCSVVGIADGDSITVLDDQRRQHKIRLAGIDSPERQQGPSIRSSRPVIRERPEVAESSHRIGRLSCGQARMSAFGRERAPQQPGRRTAIDGVQRFAAAGYGAWPKRSSN